MSFEKYISPSSSVKSDFINQMQKIESEIESLNKDDIIISLATQEHVHQKQYQIKLQVFLCSQNNI
jgi:cobalamin biosynthesis Co2+ chelatase CbiK